MFARCASRAHTLSGLLRSARLTKLRTSKLFCSGWLLSRLPAGAAILISGGSSPLSPSCESTRGVMDHFQDIYMDKEADEVALEKQNMALREEVLAESTNFKHPCRSQSWIWQFLYRICRSAYLVTLWTPVALMYAAVRLVDSTALREAWLDLALWTIEASGCIFIKVAQWCSMRPDMFPMDLIDRLQVLQQVNGTHSMSHTRQEIRSSFGRELEDIFSEINPVPIASGSIAQVHHARLRSNGQEVAVKVRHPNVLQNTYVDMHIVGTLVLMSRAIFSAPFESDGIVRHMQKQVDLSVEAQNLRLFRANFAREMRSGLVIFPEAVEGLVSPSVLVETWCEGKEVTNFFHRAWTREGIDHTAEATLNQADRERNSLIARTLFDVYMKMFLRDNCIHGDLHGGNVLYRGQSEGKADTPGVDRLSIIDVGLINSLPPDVQTGFASFLVAMVKGDSDGLVKQIRASNTNASALASPEDVAVFRAKVRDIFDHEVNFESMRAPNGDPIHGGNIVGSVMRAMQECDILIDKDFAGALWAMCVGEGLVKQLDPTFDVVGEAPPYFTRYAGAGLLREFTTRKIVTETVQSYWQSVMSSVREHFPIFGSASDDFDTDVRATHAELPVLIDQQ